MSQGIQSRPARWLVLAFTLGLLGGLIGSLLRRHPESPYRSDLDRQRRALVD